MTNNQGTKEFWNSMNTKGLSKARLGSNVMNFRNKQSQDQINTQDNQFKKIKQEYKDIDNRLRQYGK